MTTTERSVGHTAAPPLVTDLDERILSWNKRAEQVFGVAASQVDEFDRIMAITPPDELPERDALFRRVAEGHTTVFEATRRAIDGRQVVDLGIRQDAR